MSSANQLKDKNMKRTLLVISLFALSMPAFAEETVLYPKSTLTLASQQMGVPVQATFDRFTAHIDFDPTKPEASKISTDVDITSFDFSPEIDGNVQEKSWLNAKDFPQAHFQASSVKALGGGKFEARGPLTIKGKTIEVVAPFTYTANAGNATYEGTFKISRLQYNVGEGDWKETDTVPEGVQITFKIVTAKK